MQYKVYSGTNLVDVIGSGRNYFKDSQLMSSFNPGAQEMEWYVQPDTDDPNVNVLHLLTSWSGANSGIYFGDGHLYEAMAVGDSYTYSFDVKGQGNINMLTTRREGSNPYQVETTFPLTQDWQRYSVSSTVLNTKGSFCIYFDTTQLKANAYVKHIKIEKTINPDPAWSEAPEDLGLDPMQTNLHGYQLTGLTPATSYTMSVVANNGLRDSSKASVTFTTADTVVIPRALTVGSTVSLSYVEYALGLVPIGNEPSGDFGGTKAKILTGKVASVSGSNSTIEFSGVTFAAGKAMTLNAGGVYMAVDGYKSIYYKP